MKRFRFSLSALMLSVLAAALLCGAIAYHLKTVAQLRAELEALRRKAVMERDRAMMNEAVARKQSEEALQQLTALQQGMEHPETSKSGP